MACQRRRWHQASCLVGASGMGQSIAGKLQRTCTARVYMCVCMYLCWDWGPPNACLYLSRLPLRAGCSKRPALAELRMRIRRCSCRSCAVGALCLTRARRQVELALHLIQPADSPGKGKALFLAAQPPRSRCSLCGRCRHRCHAAICRKIGAQLGAFDGRLKLQAREDGEACWRFYWCEDMETSAHAPGSAAWARKDASKPRSHALATGSCPHKRACRPTDRLQITIANSCHYPGSRTSQTRTCSCSRSMIGSLWSAPTNSWSGGAAAEHTRRVRWLYSSSTWQAGRVRVRGRVGGLKGAAGTRHSVQY